MWGSPIPPLRDPCALPGPLRTIIGSPLSATYWGCREKQPRPMVGPTKGTGWQAHLHAGMERRSWRSGSVYERSQRIVRFPPRQLRLRDQLCSVGREHLGSHAAELVLSVFGSVILRRRRLVHLSVAVGDADRLDAASRPTAAAARACRPRRAGTPGRRCAKRVHVVRATISTAMARATFLA